MTKSLKQGELRKGVTERVRRGGHHIACLPLSFFAEKTTMRHRAVKFLVRMVLRLLKPGESLNIKWLAIAERDVCQEIKDLRRSLRI